MFIINGFLRCAIGAAIILGWLSLTACGSIGPRESIPASDLYKVVRHEAGR